MYSPIGYPVIIANPDYRAGIAQLVEQLLRKQLVGGSSPLSGTKLLKVLPGHILTGQSVPALQSDSNY